MKIQSLAIMFIILILPISLLLSSYTQNRVETIRRQSMYDTNLSGATYDALKAYQLNSLNSETSDYANSKMRNVKASVNTFFNSMATNFSNVGYTKETIQNYIPAVVYTMYDGYYIYSPYTNTWDAETIEKHGSDVSYSDNEILFGLKPYVYYSCRYKRGTQDDFIITYSLDNYIWIQGIVNGNPVSKYGYLISDVEVSGDSVTYRGIDITEEPALIENIFVDGQERKLPYIKINGTKYYNDGTNVFSVINGKSIKQTNIPFNGNDNSAKEYYKQAYELRMFIENNLSDLKISDAVDTDGNKFADDNTNPYQQLRDEKLFDYDHGNGIEAENSNFNTHRIDVIKYSVEKNLSVAISNFNNYSQASVNFQMPKLKDTDWDKIINNISIISFLQGVNIGGKVYNGYSVVTNTKNEDVVSEGSIYIKTNDDNVYHKVIETGIKDNNSSKIGVFNIDLERKTAEDSNGNTKYYFPKEGTLSYESLVMQNNTEDISINEYFNISDMRRESKLKELAKVYYTALGRERYSLYRSQILFD